MNHIILSGQEHRPALSNLRGDLQQLSCDRQQSQCCSERNASKCNSDVRTSTTSVGERSLSVICRNRTVRRRLMNSMAFEMLFTKAVQAATASSTVQVGCDSTQHGSEEALANHLC